MCSVRSDWMFSPVKIILEDLFVPLGFRKAREYYLLSHWSVAAGHTRSCGILAEWTIEVPREELEISKKKALRKACVSDVELPLL